MGEDKTGEFYTDADIKKLHPEVKEELIKQAAEFFTDVEDKEKIVQSKEDCPEGIKTFGHELETLLRTERLDERKKKPLVLYDREHFSELMKFFPNKMAPEFTRGLVETMTPVNELKTAYSKPKDIENEFWTNYCILNSLFVNGRPINIGGYPSYNRNAFGRRVPLSKIMHPNLRYKILDKILSSRQNGRRFEISYLGGRKSYEKGQFWVGYGQALQQTESYAQWLFAPAFNAILMDEGLITALGAGSVAIKGRLSIYDELRLVVIGGSTDDRSQYEVFDHKEVPFRPQPVLVGVEEKFYKGVASSNFDQGVLRDERIPKRWRRMVSHWLNYLPIFLKKTDDGWERKGILRSLLDASWMFERPRLGLYEQDRTLFAIEKRAKGAQCSSFENAALLLFDLYSSLGLAKKYEQQGFIPIPLTAKKANIERGIAMGRLPDKMFYEPTAQGVKKVSASVLVYDRLELAMEEAKKFGNCEELLPYFHVIGCRAGCKDWCKKYDLEYVHLPTSAQWQRKQIIERFPKAAKGRRIPAKVLEDVMDLYCDYADRNQPLGAKEGVFTPSCGLF